MGTTSTTHELPTEQIDTQVSLDQEQAQTPPVEFEDTLSEGSIKDRDALADLFERTATAMRAATTYREVDQVFEKSSTEGDTVGTGLIETLGDLHERALVASLAVTGGHHGEGEEA